MNAAASPEIVAGLEGPVRVLAVASSGGHWVQLMRLRPAWRGCDVAYLTSEKSYGRQVRNQAEREGTAPPRFYITVSANRWQKLRLLRQLLTIAWVVARERPAVVCTTGAAPGYFAIRMGKMLGARTIWIDSIANAGEMSLAGRKAGKHADLWLTQWENVAAAEADDGKRPGYWGAVL
jgi:UDP-N-acetylglucosamine:LPS N-acetylglucosamine transferase